MVTAALVILLMTTLFSKFLAEPLLSLVENKVLNAVQRTDEAQTKTSLGWCKMNIQRATLIFAILALTVAVAVAVPFGWYRKPFGFASTFNRGRSLGIWSPGYWHGFDIDGYTRNG
ncbi:hypothetical protein C7M84_015229 [Penaeus vannamei]|uniref:Uncharacterized protein n=1 Tax=Penaeus vannamei TaxID=6689 RepID=A0A423UBG0_PENVA|nr:hypothetical protein C7M84_015229 [Penaeus vannamei]